MDEKRKKWVFYLGDDRWSNAESIELKKQILKSYDDAIDDINSQFMTLSASERNEETEDYHSRIREVKEDDDQKYSKISPYAVIGSSVEAWNDYRKDWKCYKCNYISNTFLDFIPKK